AGSATAIAAFSTGPAGAGDLRRRAAPARPDLVDVDLEDRALLALSGLIASRLQPARDDHPHAALERLGDVLGRLTPDRTGEEQRLAVLPLVGLSVEGPRRRGDAEVRDRRT